MSGTMDRPNVFIDQRETSESLSEFQKFITDQWTLFNSRIGFYGDARFPKTLIVLKNKEDVRDLYDIFSRNAIQYMTSEEGFTRLCQTIDNSTPAEVKKRIMEEWHRVDTETRILIASPIDNDDLIAPDVENYIVFEMQTSERRVTCWQRMARMAGQKGTILTITPNQELLLNYHLKWKCPTKTEVERYIWRPRTWQTDRRRIWENTLMWRGVPKEEWKNATLDHFCDEIRHRGAYFKDGKCWPKDWENMAKDQEMWKLAKEGKEKYFEQIRSAQEAERARKH